MSSQRTKHVRAETVHGEVEYETVECDHCETDTMADDVIQVGIGTVKYRCSGVNICEAAHEKPEDVRVLCEYCADSLFDFNTDNRGFTQYFDGMTPKERLFAKTLGRSAALLLGLIVATTILVEVLA